jgi:hypothetical protein
VGDSYVFTSVLLRGVPMDYCINIEITGIKIFVLLRFIGIDPPRYNSRDHFNPFLMTQSNIKIQDLIIKLLTFVLL